MKAVVLTLGCKVNQYESFAIMRELEQLGYTVSEEQEPADLYVINTCSVTAEAERKSSQFYAKAMALSPQAKVIFCGCASQRDPDKFVKKADNVLVLGTFGKGKLTALLQESGNRLIAEPTDYEDDMLPLKPRTRAYIKVQDGCNNFCSYCVIPYLRGRSRSRNIDSIRREMLGLIDCCKEFVLTGINLSAYGLDIGSSLAELLNALGDLPVRIRLGSLEVAVIDAKLLEAAAGLQDFCPHFHLSLQSGSNDVLRDMNRHYTSFQYKKSVELIRATFPNAAITTDVIVGFPTESRADFDTTLRFCEEIGFFDIHIFPYSPRSGTAAHKRYFALEKSIVAGRVQELTALKNELKQRYFAAHEGKLGRLLVEERMSEGFYTGYTENYIRCFLSKKVNKNEIYNVVYGKPLADGVEVTLYE